QLADAIHRASHRAAGPYIVVDCGAIPESLIASELFGYVNGAFTGASADKQGLIAAAHDGTLFLDEIGELPLGLQAKLLRVLQEGEIRRVGDTQTVAVDVRLVCATLRDLGGDVAAGRFREDLYYRINVLPIRVPALRERADDIPLLARFFARRVADRHHLGTIELTDDALATLQAQPWPGNVRELENVIERTVVLADGPVDTAFLTSIMTVQTTGAASGAGSAPDLAALSIKKATRDLEADLIARALAATAGNRTNAAKLLEISHRALLYKMKEYGIT
ncbi:MAG: sigma 54-interacting transcriptional regulator, partial [Proteobacteria bacterium]|nr:sigma 54-interacting transcriptional regulator [Pseudomonadota bacterium]